MMKKSNPLSVVLMLLWATLCMLASCKKYVDPPAYFEEEIPKRVLTKRKVLLIGIDGAAGAVLKAINPPNLTSMLQYSKYSWDAMSDFGTSDAASWQTILSGLSYGTHQIWDSSFQYKFSGTVEAEEHEAPPLYPSVYTGILISNRPQTTSMIISSWKELIENPGKGAQKHILTSGDINSKDSLIKYLNGSIADFSVVNFAAPAMAGKASSFSAEATQYVNALKTTDAYIGEILNAIKAREQKMPDEDWLIIVTGTHGGKNNSYGNFDLDEQRVFTAYYNKNIKSQEFHLNGSVAVAPLLAENQAKLPSGEMYDPSGIGNDITYHFKIKRETYAVGQRIFYKIDETSGRGFETFMYGGFWAIKMVGQSGTRNIYFGSDQSNDITNANGPEYYTIDLCFFDSLVNGSVNRFLARYTNGVRVPNGSGGDNNITNIGSLSSNAPLSFGGSGVSSPIFDIAVFNKKLSNEEIARYQCSLSIADPANVTATKLSGYWPATEGFGGVLYNKIQPAYFFKYSTIPGWKYFDASDNLPCNLRIGTVSPNVVTYLMTNVDVTANILYWLRINLPSSFKKDGNSFLSRFDNEFEK